MICWAALSRAESASLRRWLTSQENVLRAQCGLQFGNVDGARLNEALARFSALEEQRTMRQHLVLARQHRERIKAIVDFLQEVDDLMINEPDRSVYTELALLFEEIASIATEGAASMHSLADLRPEDEA